MVVGLRSLLLTCWPLGAVCSSPSFSEWFEARSGPQGSSTWLYQGGLYDPLTGTQIAHVEGLEIIQTLVSPIDCQDLKTPRIKSGKAKAVPDAVAVPDQTRALDLFAIRDSLLNPNAKFQKTGIVVSRKIFIYRHKDDKTKLLQEIKLRPYSPQRKIPLNQAVSAYATVNTFIERSPREWILHGEWPDGKTVWNQATVIRESDTLWPHESNEESTTTTSNTVPRLETRKPVNNNDNTRSSKLKTLEFTVHVRPRTGNQQKLAPDLTKKPESTSPNTTPTTRSPPRSALFSFGPSNIEKPMMGARETYQYEWNTAKPNFWNKLGNVLKLGNERGLPLECTVRYTRYGEGPVWYGPHRFCTLELRGKRWPNNSPLPDHIEAWCQRHRWDRPFLLSKKNGGETLDLIRSFRENDLDLGEIYGLKLISKVGAREPNDWKQRLLQKAQKWAAMLKQATTLELPLPSRP